MSTLEQTERTADRIRTDLLATLQELDRRRVRALDFRHQATQHLGALALGATVLILAVGVGVLLRVRRRRALGAARKERWRAFLRAWQHPDRLASRAKDRPLPAELGRRAAVAFSAALVTRVARRAASRLVG